MATLNIPINANEVPMYFVSSKSSFDIDSYNTAFSKLLKIGSGYYMKGFSKNSPYFKPVNNSIIVGKRSYPYANVVYKRNGEYNPSEYIYLDMANSSSSYSPLFNESFSGDYLPFVVKYNSRASEGGVSYTCINYVVCYARVNGGYNSHSWSYRWGSNYFQTWDSLATQYYGKEPEKYSKYLQYSGNVDNISVGSYFDYWTYNNKTFYVNYSSGFANLLHESDDVYCFTNMPIIDITGTIISTSLSSILDELNKHTKQCDELYKYLTTGVDTTTHDYFNDFSQEYNLYIDGEKKPNYKLTWNSEIDSDIAEKSKIELLIYNEIGYKDFKTVDYIDGNISFIWQDLVEILPDTLLERNSIKFAVRFVYNDYLGTVCGVTLNRKKTLLNPELWEDVYYEEVVDGSLLTVLIGTGEEDDGYVPPDNTDDGNDEAGDGSYSTSCALTKTYSMTLSRLRSLGSFLWNSSFIDDIHLINNSPIENIVSVKAFPFNIDGSDEIIELGNVNTGVNGCLLSSNVFTINKGSVLIDEKYGSFLDYAPYTKVALHLPYIGFVELDTNLIMGKTISVRYIVDLVEGGCLAQILLGSRVINEYKGDMGIDVPITSSNRAQVQASHVAGAIGAATGIASTAIGAASGNPMAIAYGISNTANSLLDSAVSPYHYSTQGGGSPAVSSGKGANRNVYVIIDRPMYQDLGAFNHTKGRLCNLSKRIGGLKGFTSTTPMIDLNGIPCTAAEKEEIRQILSSGFFA